MATSDPETAVAPAEVAAEVREGVLDAALAEQARPVTAPGEMESATRPDSADGIVLDLEALTAEVVPLFRAGRQQEALDMALAFTKAAGDNLGQAHPTYINALATVAALVDQMGGSEEADALLFQAEGLHQAVEAQRRREEAPSPEDGSSDESYSEDEWSGGSSEGASEGDVEGDLDWEGGEEEDEGEAAEAEAITRLTWEVNALLQEGNPEKAAKLLADAEKVLFDYDDVSHVNGVTRAALHTLWAAVLDAVGEPEKAQTLYQEALDCLEEEVGAVSSSGSTSDGSSSEEESGDEEGESAAEDPEGPRQPQQEANHEGRGQEVEEPSRAEEGQQQPEPPPAGQAQEPLQPQPPPTAPRPQEQQEQPQPQTQTQQPPEAPEPPQQPQEAPQHAPPPQAPQPPPVAQASSSSACGSAADRGAAGSVADSSSGGAFFITAEDTTGSAPAAPAPLPQESQSSGAASVAGPAAAGPEASAPTPASPAKPKAPPSKAGSRPSRRPVPLAPQPPKAAGGSPGPPQAKAPARVGGGFAAVAPPPKAKAPPGKKLLQAPARRAAKAKARPSGTSESLDPGGEAVAEGPAEDVEEAHPEPQEEEAASSNGPAERTVEEQRVALERTMTTVDHLLGLLNVARAAEKMEEQLVQLAEGSSPLKGSDTHVDMLAKYGGVLWWDNDLEGAVDALLAADEILGERPTQDAKVRLRRTDVWGRLAQVQRARGQLDEADRHLSNAINCLTELVEAGEAGDAVQCVDALHEAQAALGQVCVQKEDYERAEKLYLAAFSPGRDGDAASGGAKNSADVEADS